MNFHVSVFFSRPQVTNYYHLNYFISVFAFTFLILHGFCLQSLAGQYYSSKKLNEGHIAVPHKTGLCVTLKQTASILTFSDCRQDSSHLPLAN